MPVGGKRPGAGRPRGAKQKVPNVDRRKAAEGGLMPLDVMLGNMRFFHAEAAALLAKASGIENPGPEAIDTLKALFATRQQAQECAKDAAPYLHAKLQSTVLTGKDGGPVEVADVSPLELARRLGFILATAAATKA